MSDNMEIPIHKNELVELLQTKAWQLIERDLKELENADKTELILGLKFITDPQTSQRIPVRLTEEDTWYLRGRLSIYKWLNDIINYGAIDND